MPAIFGMYWSKERATPVMLLFHRAHGALLHEYLHHIQKTASIWKGPGIRPARGLATLQGLGNPAEVMREAKGRLFGV